MTDVHHCPRCELRFGNRAELVDHLVVEHRFAAEALEQLRYQRSPSEDGQREDGRRCLIVANQAIGHPEVMAAIRGRIDAGVTRFLVVVPATALADQWYTPVPDVGEGHAADALAEARLASLLETLVAAGFEAEGRVGPADPELAVRTLLREQRVDEILVTTLPVGISRWLGIDLPGRLRRQCGLPVTTVEVAAERAPDIDRANAWTRGRRARSGAGPPGR